MFYNLSFYTCMYNGNPVPNNVMNGLTREMMLSKIIGKGFTVKVKIRLFYFGFVQMYYKIAAF